MADESAPVPVEVVGVRVELPSNQPIVLLREEGGTRYLPIWIGANEATAIATAMEGVQPARPLTHDLMRSIIDALGALAVRVVITEMRDAVFFADLTLDLSGEEFTVSSRPSDAIALAVRTGTPVFASPGVLEEAAVLFEDEDEEEEVAKFREFLEEVTVEDFLGGEPGNG
jgi:bifunctional DNase/RNase